MIWQLYKFVNKTFSKSNEYLRGCKISIDCVGSKWRG